MNMHFLLFLPLCLLLFTHAQPVSAQDNAIPEALIVDQGRLTFRESEEELEHQRMLQNMSPEEKARRAMQIYESLPEEDKISYINAAEQAYAYCEGRYPFSRFHDCRCIGTRVFEEVLLNPNPDISPITVGDMVADECPNVEGAAAFAYDNCISSIGHNMVYGREAFCECYANEFAGFYEGNVASNYGHFSQLGSSAILTCDAKGIPSPLNPER